MALDYRGRIVKLTVFGLSLSSSWGNGHATQYRAILRALSLLGFEIWFFEKDVPYYSAHRDMVVCSYCNLVLYQDWDDVRRQALDCAGSSDVVITSSYCPDGVRISDEMLALNAPLCVFYDLDTPITLKALANGTSAYLRRDQIPEFGLYLSFTGGPFLEIVRRDLGARLVRPLFGCVDPALYSKRQKQPEFECALSYMGTYARDRDAKVEELFRRPARQRPEERFILAGSMYPADTAWPRNVRRIEHLPPAQHPGFYSSSRATLNITRQDMAEAGYCPSGRFFEASACGTALLTDDWPGLDFFFEIGRELLVVRTAEDVLKALARDENELAEIGERSRRRTLEQHTGDRRARELLAFCEEASRKPSYAEGVTR